MSATATTWPLVLTATADAEWCGAISSWVGNDFIAPPGTQSYYGVAELQEPADLQRQLKFYQLKETVGALRMSVDARRATLSADLSRLEDCLGRMRAEIQVLQSELTGKPVSVAPVGVQSRGLATPGHRAPAGSQDGIIGMSYSPAVPVVRSYFARHAGARNRLVSNKPKKTLEDLTIKHWMTADKAGRVVRRVRTLTAKYMTTHQRDLTPEDCRYLQLQAIFVHTRRDGNQAVFCL